MDRPPCSPPLVRGDESETTSLKWALVTATKRRLSLPNRDDVMLRSEEERSLRYRRAGHADFAHREDSVGIRNSAETVRTLVKREVEDGRVPHRIVLAGFSQGGAIVLHAGLRYPERLGGILALSTYLPLGKALEDEAHPSNAGIPIFMAHGTEDPIVPLTRAQQSRAMLEDKGYSVEWHNYPMQHAVCMPEIQHVAAWLETVLA